MPGRPPANYFPVKKTPLRMQAGLMPFGTDFGNGEVDRQYFQVDDQHDRYARAKLGVPASRHAVLERDEAERAVHVRVLAWIQETLAREHPELARGLAADYRALSLAVQEDLVVLHRRPGGENAAILVDVSFPSDWRPERIVDTDFRFIHGPVPDFADGAAQAASLVSAMIERGPYVRFVWTLAADDFLDHHPEEGQHRSWSPASRGYLRVERQVTVPFTDVQASLFLIRTYIYAFESLAPEQRHVLRQAIETMPAAPARYKNIEKHKSVILSLL